MSTKLSATSRYQQTIAMPWNPLKDIQRWCSWFLFSFFFGLNCATKGWPNSDYLINRAIENICTKKKRKKEKTTTSRISDTVQLDFRGGRWKTWWVRWCGCRNWAVCRRRWAWAPSGCRARRPTSASSTSASRSPAKRSSSAAPPEPSAASSVRSPKSKVRQWNRPFLSFFFHLSPIWVSSAGIRWQKWTTAPAPPPKKNWVSIRKSARSMGRAEASSATDPTQINCTSSQLNQF